MNNFINKWGFIIAMCILLVDIVFSIFTRPVAIAERLERADTRIDAHMRGNEIKIYRIEKSIDLLMAFEEQRAHSPFYINTQPMVLDPKGGLEPTESNLQQDLNPPGQFPRL